MALSMYSVYYNIARHFCHENEAHRHLTMHCRSFHHRWRRLESGPKVPYLVRVTKKMEIRKGPGTSYVKADRKCQVGIYTIVEVKNGWGKLKSGAGWILLKGTEKV